MAERYCRHKSKDTVHKLEGRDPCRACDVRTMAVINDGREYKDFPAACPYCTEDLKAVQAEVEAWKKDTENREQRHAEHMKQADEGGGRGYLRPDQQLF